MMEKLRHIDKVIVKYHDQIVGSLMMAPDSESVEFQYAQWWMSL